MKLKFIRNAIIGSTIIFFISNTNVYANLDNITIDSIFTYEDGLWHPGREESKSFNIYNNIDKDIKLESINISLYSSEKYKTGEVLNQNSKEFKEISKNTLVNLKHNEKSLFKGTLSQLCEDKSIKLEKEIIINKNSSEEFNIIIDMDENIGNEAQAIRNEFNIGVTYKVHSDSIIDGGNDSEQDKLPQTGGVINSSTLLALGTIAIGYGMVLNKKSSNNKGGKQNE